MYVELTALDSDEAVHAVTLASGIWELAREPRREQKEPTLRPQYQDYYEQIKQ